MIKLLAVCPNPLDATSFYRGVGPLGALRHKVDTFYPDQVDWTTLKKCDIVFMQRPFRDAHLAVIRQAKKQNKPVWVDYDDELFEVPRDNKAYELYAADNHRENMKEALSVADVVTSSTQALADRFIKFNKNSVLIPNAFDDDVFDIKRNVNQKDGRKIFWRGGDSHQRDLATAAKSFIQVAAEKPTWRFHFMGYNPWFITEQMAEGQAVVHQGIDIIEYFDYLKEQAPAVVAVPLVSSAFNEAKSNIAWIEAAYAGAITVAPNILEWHRPGVLRYNKPEEFGAVLKTAMNMSYDSRKRLAVETWDYVCETLLLSKINEKRLELLESLA